MLRNPTSNPFCDAIPGNPSSETIFQRDVRPGKFVVVPENQSAK